VRQGRQRAPSNVRYAVMERAAFVVYCLLFVALPWPSRGLLPASGWSGTTARHGSTVMILPSLPLKAKSKLSFDSS
jgi:hypothetical protein